MCAILSDYIGLPFICTSQHTANCIEYSDKADSTSFTIYDYGLLNDDDIKPYNIDDVAIWEDTYIPFLAPPGFRLPFDIFSALFYYLTHYDAYFAYEADIHGRIRKEDTIAFKHNNFKKPVVEYWIKKFVAILNDYFHLNIILPHKYEVNLTMDVDHYSLIQQRGFLGNIKGKIYSRDYPIRLLKKQGWIEDNDPFSIFKYLGKNHPSIQYFLLLQSGTHNSINNIDSKYIQHKFSSSGIDNEKIGIHYSYQSSFSNSFATENAIFYHSFSVYPKKSRAHFLRYFMPQYFQNILQIGIEEDYSLGYYDTIGFITGMSRPYIWYDITQEQITTLKVYPFAMMDATYLYYKNCVKKEIIAEIIELKKNIKEVEGLFTVLLHNDILSQAMEGELFGEVIFFYIFSE